MTTSHMFDCCDYIAPSWKSYSLIIGLAVGIAFLSVSASPVLWFVVAGILVVACQLFNQLNSLAVVMLSCGLLNYSPYETGALSRIFPGDIAMALFLVAWLAKQRPWSIKGMFYPDLMNGPLFAMAIIVPFTMLWARLHPDPSVTYSFPHSDVSLTVTQISQMGLLASTICMPFAVAAAIKSWKNIEFVIIVMGGVAAIGSMVTAAAMAFGFGGSYEILGVTRAYWEQPWQSSMFVTVSILPFLYSAVLFGRPSVSSYRFICVLFVICLAGVILTFSRECWLLAVFEILLVSGMRLRRSLASLAAVLILAILLFVVMSLGSMSSVSQFYNPNEVYGLERIYYYITALQLFISHPILGVGAGNYQFFDRLYEGVSAGGIAHNQFLTIAAEMGVLGFAVFVWFVICLLRLGRKLKPSQEGSRDADYWFKPAASCFVLAWLSECFFSEAFFVSAAAGGGTKTITVPIFAWILLGLLFAAIRLDEAKSAQNGHLSEA
jgi:O-antigen ligase